MENKLKTIELFVDEESEFAVEAISLVESPAIEVDFVALNEHKVEFKSIDEDKRIVVGLALVPNKLIYRRRGDFEYNIVFSEDTVSRAAELYLSRLKVNNATLEHQEQTEGVSVIQSWIVENPEMDKTKLYGLSAPKGAWAVVMKINNETVWADIKEGKYLGLSIEGVFTDDIEKSLNKSAMELSKENDVELSQEEKDEAEALETLNKLKDLLK